MDVLFIHPNFPGQFLHLAERLSQEPGYRVHALGDESWMSPGYSVPKVTRLTYPAPEPAGKDTHQYVQNFEAAIRRGQQVVRTLMTHKHQGFEPDVIYIHPGWGDGLFLKEMFPTATVVGLFEYYYHTRGADVGFDPQFPLSFNDLFRIRTLNTVQLHALDSTDIHLSPTAWQRSRYPAVYQAGMSVLHEGIDTARLKPDGTASITLPDGHVARAGDEVLTFVSRSLEPYRGFHSLMRALPAIQAARPDCHVIIVGADKHHYGPSPTRAPSWREQYLKELNGQLDTSRLHFAGTLPYSEYVKVLQVSRAHVYLTYPFILSWSMLEAMAAGCLVLGSATAPVQEIIRHGENGLLFPFFDTNALASLATQALAEPERFATIRRAAMTGMRARYDFNEAVFPQHLALLSRLRKG